MLISLAEESFFVATGHLTRPPSLPTAHLFIYDVTITIHYTYAACGDNFHACLYCCLPRLVDFLPTNETMVQGYLACRIPSRRIRTFSSQFVRWLTQICSFLQLEDIIISENARLQNTGIKISCHIIEVLYCLQ